MQKDIGSFKVPVNDIFLMQSSKPIDNVFEKVDCFCLGQSFHFIDVLLKGAIFTILHHNKYGIIAFEVIDKADNIGVIPTGFHDFDL